MNRLMVGSSIVHLNALPIYHAEDLGGNAMMNTCLNLHSFSIFTGLLDYHSQYFVMTLQLIFSQKYFSNFFCAGLHFPPPVLDMPDKEIKENYPMKSQHQVFTFEMLRSPKCWAPSFTHIRVDSKYIIHFLCLTKTKLTSMHLPVLPPCITHIVVNAGIK